MFGSHAKQDQREGKKGQIIHLGWENFWDTKGRKSEYLGLASECMPSSSEKQDIDTVNVQTSLKN